MLCQAVYDNQGQIPEFARGEFTQRPDGKWALKEDAIPGAAELFNPGLAANRDRALQQKQAADEKAQQAETRAAEAERQLATVRAPGSTVLGPEDSKAWQKLVALGDVKTIEKIVKEEYPSLKASAELRERETAWRQAADDMKEVGLPINFDVLRDILTHPQHGEGVTVERRLVNVEFTAADGSKTIRAVNFPHVVKKTPVAGKTNEFETTATPLHDFARSTWPAYLVTALTTPAQDAASAAAAGVGVGQQQPGGAQAGAGGEGLLPLSPGGAQPGGGFGFNFGGGAPGVGVGQQQPGGGAAAPVVAVVAGQPGATGFAGVRLPAMGAGGGSSGGGAQAGALDGAAVAEQFNAARGVGKGNALQPATPPPASAQK